jgi:2-dehydro-3-deoxygluconokinase
MKIAFFGECMIELSGSPLQRGFGGDTLNSALYLARLSQHNGLQVSYATAMGTDALSQTIIDAWQDEQIDTSLVSQFENKQPGLYLVETDSAGERSFLYWRSDSAVKEYFSRGISPLQKHLAELDYIYLSGISLAVLSDQSQAQLFDLLTTFKQSGGKVIFDNNFRPQLWSAEQAKQCYLKILTLTDIALLTEDDEIAVFADTHYQDIFTRCAQLGVNEVVIKRGLLPCIIATNASQIAEVAATKVDKVVDTCAAGDSFAAGYLSKRLLGATVEQAAQAGHLLASTVIQYPGAIIAPKNMPNL